MRKCTEVLQFLASQRLNSQAMLRKRSLSQIVKHKQQNTTKMTIKKTKNDFFFKGAIQEAHQNVLETMEARRRNYIFTVLKIQLKI